MPFFGIGQGLFGGGQQAPQQPNAAAGAGGQQNNNQIQQQQQAALGNLQHQVIIQQGIGLGAYNAAWYLPPRPAPRPVRLSTMSLIDKIAVDCANNDINLTELVVSKNTFMKLVTEMPIAAGYVRDSALPEMPRSLTVSTAIGNIRIVYEKTYDLREYMETVD